MLTKMLEDMPGEIRWVDLTVRDAPAIREFYEAVVGWKSSPVSMGDYSDWTMAPNNIEEPVAGVCHARGQNDGLPPAWLIYITVADLHASMAACRERGGEVVFGPKNFGPEGSWCVIRDPAGAYAALFEPKAIA
jgi:predicted enzyme related to lactoylglutathione lyase